MRKKILLLAITSVLGYSQSLQYYFEKLESNPLLKKQENLIQIAKQKSELSSTWENPNLMIGANDLLIDDFARRDIEPMQTQFVAISQKIPTNGKLSIKKCISKSEEKISALLYEDRLLRLKSSLAFEIFNLEILKKELSLYARYIKNIKKIESLLLSHILSSNGTQTDLQRLKILKGRWRIKRDRLKRSIKVSRLKIKKLIYEDISYPNVSLTMMENPLLSLDTHPLILAYKLKIKKDSNSLELQKAKKMPDLKVSLGYFQREDRKDYLSASLSLPLPVRGREERDISIATLELQNQKEELEDLKNSFVSESKILQEELKEAKRSYKKIKRVLIPSQKKIGRLIEKDIFSKSSSSADLIDNLNNTVSLELESLGVLKEYFRAYSKLIYFSGGVL